MTMQAILDGFARLGIQKEQYPDYSDPNTFATNLQKVSILRDVPIVYAASANEGKQGKCS